MDHTSKNVEYSLAMNNILSVHNKTKKILHTSKTDFNINKYNCRPAKVQVIVSVCSDLMSPISSEII